MNLSLTGFKLTRMFCSILNENTLFIYIGSGGKMLTGWLAGNAYRFLNWGELHRCASLASLKR